MLVPHHVSQGKRAIIIHQIFPNSAINHNLNDVMRLELAVVQNDIWEELPIYSFPEVFKIYENGPKVI